MFNHERGLGPGKWLWWFIGIAAAYAVSTVFLPAGIADVLGETIGRDIVYAAIIAFCAWRIYKVFFKR